MLPEVPPTAYPIGMTILYSADFGEGAMVVYELEPGSFSIWREDLDGSREEVMSGFKDLEYAMRAAREAAGCIKDVLERWNRVQGRPSGT